MTDLDYEGPVSYLVSRSRLVLSSLQDSFGDNNGAVTLYSDLRSPQGKRVALCLFGSGRNICDCSPEPPEWRKYGWTSSSNEGVELLLQAGVHAEDSNNPEAFWRETAERKGADLHEICWNAQNICSRQGMSRGQPNNFPWHRGYTIGQYEDVEWLARIYFTYDEAIEGQRNRLATHFNVIHVGAAIWVRSGSPEAWTPYTAENIAKLDAAQHPVRQQPVATRRRRIRRFFT